MEKIAEKKGLTATHKLVYVCKHVHIGKQHNLIYSDSLLSPREIFLVRRLRKGRDYDSEEDIHELQEHLLFYWKRVFQEMIIQSIYDYQTVNEVHLIFQIGCFEPITSQQVHDLKHWAYSLPKKRSRQGILNKTAAVSITAEAVLLQEEDIQEKLTAFQTRLTELAADIQSLMVTVNQQEAGIPVMAAIDGTSVDQETDQTDKQLESTIEATAETIVEEEEILELTAEIEEQQPPFLEQPKLLDKEAAAEDEPVPISLKQQVLAAVQTAPVRTRAGFTEEEVPTVIELVKGHQFIEIEKALVDQYAERITTALASAKHATGNGKYRKSEVIKKIKRLEFIEYLWSQVEPWVVTNQTVFDDTLDLYSLVHDAVRFFDAQKSFMYHGLLRGRQIHYSQKNYHLAQAYNDLGNLLETLLEHVKYYERLAEKERN